MSDRLVVAFGGGEVGAFVGGEWLGWVADDGDVDGGDGGEGCEGFELSWVC